MISDWKEIASRVAKEMNLEPEYVEQNVQLYSENLLNELRQLSHREYDFFFLGKMKIREQALLTFLYRAEAKAKRMTRLKEGGKLDYRHKAIDVSLKEGRLPLKNRNSVSNMITGFRKDGLVHGTGKKTKLHPHIKPILDDISFTIEFKLLRDDPLDKGKVTREREEADVV